MIQTVLLKNEKIKLSQQTQILFLILIKAKIPIFLQGVFEPRITIVKISENDCVRKGKQLKKILKT